MYSFTAGKCKRLVVWAVPTQNLPIRSISPSPVTTRQELVGYRNIEQFRKKILALELSGWSKTEGNDVNNDVLFELCD